MEYKNLPDLKGWAALRAVVEKGGVSAAAKALNVGQPAVTKRLRALDASYGFRLTEKVGGRLRLTEAGEKVYMLAVLTLDRQLSLRNDLQDLVGGQTNLNLQVTIAIGEHLLPGILLRFADRYPDYRVDSRLVYGHHIQTNLANGVADLALLERAPDHPDLLVQKWMEDELWLVCGPNHPLADEDMISIAMFPDLSYVLREKGSSPRRDLGEAMARIGVNELDVVLEVGATDTLMEVLMPGTHVSFLPRFAVEDEVQTGKLHHIEVSGFHIMRTLWIARHRDNVDHPVADAFSSIVRGD